MLVCVAFEQFGSVGCCGVKTFVMEDYLVLQICRVKLQEALDSNHRDVMVSALKYAGRVLPFSVFYSGMIEARVIFYSYRLVPERVSFERLEFLSARWYVLGFINAIDREFSFVQYNCFRTHLAVSVLFERDELFRSDDVLYDNGVSVLRVGDLIMVCDYAVEVGEEVKHSSKFYDEAEAAVSVFKALRMVLDNKECYSQVPRMLYLANDFLLFVVKPSLGRKGHKRAVAGLGGLVDLTVEFLGRK